MKTAWSVLGVIVAALLTTPDSLATLPRRSADEQLPALWRGYGTAASRLPVSGLQCQCRGMGGIAGLRGGPALRT